jgi:integrase
MFRQTAGSRAAKKLGLPAAMEFLGHSNIETTTLYLAVDTSDLKVYDAQTNSRMI